MWGAGHQNAVHLKSSVPCVQETVTRSPHYSYPLRGFQRSRVVTEDELKHYPGVTNVPKRVGAHPGHRGILTISALRESFNIPIFLPAMKLACKRIESCTMVSGQCRSVGDTLTR
jgi:hypothetical protein